MAVLSNTMMQGSSAVTDESLYLIEHCMKNKTESASPHTQYNQDQDANRLKWTFNIWVKRFKGSTSTDLQGIFGQYYNNSNYAIAGFSNDAIRWGNRPGSGTIAVLQTKAKFRDCQQWYNLHFVWDTAQGDEYERMKLYVNGVAIPKGAFESGSSTFPDQNQASMWGYGNGTSHVLNWYENAGNGASYRLDGKWANPQYFDGQALHPSVLGKFDENSQWVPIDPYDADGCLKLPVHNKSGKTWITHISGAENTGNITNGNDANFSTQASSGNDGVLAKVSLPAGTKCQEFAVNIGGTQPGQLWVDDVLVADWGANQYSKWHYYPSQHKSDGTVSVLKWGATKGLSGAHRFYKIWLDGNKLVDDTVDPSRSTNPNQGCKWSELVTGGGATVSGWDTSTHLLAELFNGTTYTGSTANGASTTGASTAGIWDLGSANAIPCGKIRINWFASAADDWIKVNGGSAISPTNHGNWEWAEVDATSFYRLEIKDWTTYAGAIEIDGQVMKDDQHDHSFRTPLCDRYSLNRMLAGENRKRQAGGSNGTIYDPTQRNNNNGEQDVLGYSNDPNKSSLVLAVPLEVNAATDHHHTIKGSGSAHAATVNGCSVTGSSGQLMNTATMSFDGSNDYITYPDSADWDFGTGDYTAEIWCKPNDQADNYPIGRNCGGTIWGLNFWSNGGSNNTVRAGPGLHHEVNYQWANDQWYHLAVSRQSGTSRFYVNGILVDEEANTTDITGTTVLNLGQDGMGWGLYYKGQLSDCRIYKGVAKYTGSRFDPPWKRDHLNKGGNEWCRTSAECEYNTWKQSLSRDTPGAPYALDDDGDEAKGYEVGGHYASFADNTSHPDLGHGPGNSIGGGATDAWRCCFLSMPVSTGKWYFEVGNYPYSAWNKYCRPGVAYLGWDMESALGSASGSVGLHFDGVCHHNGSTTDISRNFAWQNTVQIAFDADTRKVWYGVSGTWTGDPANGTGEAATVDASPNGYYVLGASKYNDGWTVNGCHTGETKFQEEGPAGFKCLTTYNQEDLNIDDPRKHFDVLHYRGTGSKTGNNLNKLPMLFKPGLVFIKDLDNSVSWAALDQIRGGDKKLSINNDDAEVDVSSNGGGINTWDSDGLTLGTWTSVNESDGTSNGDVSTNYTGYFWNAGTSAATPSTSGSITPTAQWVNATAGFSMTKYEGTEAAATVGHGLNAKPELIIVKNMETGSSNWVVWHMGLSSTQQLHLHSADAKATGQTNSWNSTYPTNTVFSLAASWYTNDSGVDHIAYCWAPIPGYSAFGEYTGNGDTHDGPAIMTGFLPAMVMVKSKSNVANWNMFDNAYDGRNSQLKNFTNNQKGNYLRANLSNGINSDDGTGTYGIAMDFTSCGFKLRGGSATNDVNDTGEEYIYCAWAHMPNLYARGA